MKPHAVRQVAVADNGLRSHSGSRLSTLARRRHRGSSVMNGSSVATVKPQERKPGMGTFERFLTFWVALCIIAGVILGQVVPGVFHVLGEATVAQVNLPVAVLV